MKAFVKLFFGILALAAVGVGGYFAYRTGALDRFFPDQDEQASPPQETQEVAVSTCTVMLRLLRNSVRGIGTLQAAETVEIRPEVAGMLTKIHFQEGARVEKGSLLFAIDDKQLLREQESRQAALAAAQAQLENARRNYRRMQELFEQKTVTENRRDDAETAFETARAEVDRLKADLASTVERLEDAEIKAPFSGMISQRLVDAGDYVRVGDHLATLYQTDEVEVAFRVPERYMGRVKIGQHVEVMVDAYPDRRFTGSVDFVAPSVDAQSRNVLLKAVLSNSERLLMPGAFGTATVTIEERPDRPVVPEDALVPVRDGYIVYIVQDGKAVRREVLTGLREGVFVEIKEGLSGGEQVVQSGQMQLSDNSPVNVVSSESCAPEAQIVTGN